LPIELDIKHAPFSVFRWFSALMSIKWLQATYNIYIICNLSPRNT